MSVSVSVCLSVCVFACLLPCAQSKEGFLRLLSRRCVEAGEEEKAQNARARSAKLRACILGHK